MRKEKETELPAIVRRRDLQGCRVSRDSMASSWLPMSNLEVNGFLFEALSYTLSLKQYLLSTYDV